MYIEFNAANPEATNFYNENGWAAFSNVFDANSLEVLRDVVLDFSNGSIKDDDFSKILNTKNNFSGATESEDSKVKLTDHVFLRSDKISEIVSMSDIPKIAATIAMTESIRYFNSAFVIKPPVRSDENSNNVVGWHTDRAYWQSCTSDKMLTAWIPLSKITPDCGTLQVISGSHVWNHDQSSDLSNSKNFFSDDNVVFEEIMRRRFGKFNTEKMQLSYGGVSFHNSRTFHGSGINTSSEDRIGLAIHFQDSSNKWRRTPSEGSYTNEKLCRRNSEGEIDYSDPEICPQLWPRLCR